MELNVVIKIENADVLQKKCTRLAELFAETGEILGGINAGMSMTCVSVEDDGKEDKINFTPGEVFVYHGAKWVALDEVKGGIFCVAHEDFEADGDNRFRFSEDGSPDWRVSDIRRVLNEVHFRDIAERDDLIKQTIDLTADDGTRDFGVCEDYIGLLSCDQYRKYRHLLTDFRFQMLVTPYSPASAAAVCYVGTSGSLSTGSPTSYCQARPALILKSEIFKKCRGESRKEG